MESQLQVAFHTLGCKLNQAESELLARQFTEAGYRVVSGDGADIYVLNTCTVTHIADRKSRHLLRLWRKRNPEALIIATGCYAERAPQELAQVGADLVVGNEQKKHLLGELKGEPAPAARCSAEQLVAGVVSRVRSFIKIQDGCNDACAYCIVPQVRGCERCLPMADIVNEVKARVASGYKEVVLTGTKVGDYKHNGANLKQLVEQVLAVTGVERLHLSSLQPRDVSPELIRLWQDIRLCRHFHLALQSGSDAVLRRMKRHYSVDDYRQAVSLIRKAVPDVAITTDIMVGFPGETAEEFEESYRFCQEIDFANIHVFTHSPRPGTLATRMVGQINDRLKKERSLRMLELAQRSIRKFCQRFLGQIMTVLWEKEVTSGSGVYSGLSNNYIRVLTQGSEPLTNQFRSVRLVRLHNQGLWGEVTGED
ncbi:MAG: tRNA (N(6)-L-threonylcarbamoyladenosine(37)-C(2))-methylthiotransferase MtaB [Dehalococcoidia bacterium]|nr:tRNA (N(6)-L-threonylcarbamoyladenosine(37)-C(2))-methylthiotransferase MtaB [Dehalococcoidia bacterium]